MPENVEEPTSTPAETSSAHEDTPPIRKRTEALRDLVMRQTDYSADEATRKLSEHSNDIMAILREYMGAPADVDQPKTTTNQVLYKEMRGLMDNAATTHRRKKELEEQKQQYQDMMLRHRAIAIQNLKARIDVSNNSTVATDMSDNSVATDMGDNSVATDVSNN